MKKNLFRAGIFALMVWILAPIAARACDCVNAGPTCKAFANTKAVFAGRVVKITPLGNDNISTFEVTQAYRGITEKSIEVFTLGLASDCGYEFKLGASYLVYATPQNGTERLQTNRCLRTRPLSEAKDDIDFLMHKDDPARASGIVGDITMQYRDAQNRLQPTSSAAGITVVISGVAVRKTVVTRKDGHFEIWGLEPGSYRVSPVFPEGFVKTAQTVKVAAQSCEEVHFQATPPPRKGSQ